MLKTSLRKELFSLEETEAGNLFNIDQHLKGECQEHQDRFSSVVSCNWARDNGHNLEPRRFHMNITKKTFIFKGGRVT